MRKISILLLLLLPFIAMAQSKKTKARPAFQSSVGAALLFGESEPSWNVQMVNGVKLNKWFLGVGAGLDNYRYRTVPLFVSARREGILKRGLFAFADVGVSVPAVTDKQKSPVFQVDKFSTGFYSEIGGGWAIPTGKKGTVRISAGYSFRTLKEKQQFPMWSSAWPPDPKDVTIINYKFHLLTLRAAFSLGAQ